MITRITPRQLSSIVTRLILLPFRRSLYTLFIGGILAVIFGIGIVGVTLTAHEELSPGTVTSEGPGQISTSQTMSIKYDGEASRWVVAGHKPTAIGIGAAAVVIGVIMLYSRRFFGRHLDDLVSGLDDPALDALNVTRIKASKD